MTREVQRRRGTAAEHASFTGAVGELTVDTTNKSVIVHDGATAGGFTTPQHVATTNLPQTALPYIVRPTTAPLEIHISKLGLRPSGLEADGTWNLDILNGVITDLNAKSFGGSIVGSLVDPAYASPVVSISGAILHKPKVDINLGNVRFFLTNAADHMFDSAESSTTDCLVSGGTWDANNLASVSAFNFRRFNRCRIGGNGMRIRNCYEGGMIFGDGGTTGGNRVGDIVILRGTSGTHSSTSFGIHANTTVGQNDSSFFNMIISGFNLGQTGRYFHANFHNVHWWSFGGAGGSGSMDVGVDLQSTSAHNRFTLCQAGSPQVAGFRDNTGSLNTFIACQSHQQGDVAPDGTVPAFDFTGATNNTVIGCALREPDGSDFSALVAGTLTDHTIIGNTATNTICPTVWGGIQRRLQEKITIADDAVATIAMPNRNMGIYVERSPDGNSPSFPQSTLLRVSAPVGGSPRVDNLTPEAGSALDLLSDGTVLAGTTGTDGKITISAASGVMYIENRQGFSTTLSLCYLGA